SLGRVLVLFCGWMSVAITFSGMLGRRPTVSDLFRRPERKNRLPPTASSVGDVNFTFVPSHCLHGASSVAKLHSVQVNADRRDDDTWLTWLFPLPRLTGSSGAGKHQAPRSVPTTRCS